MATRQPVGFLKSVNIFYLHSNPILAARAHCDKHVNKMAMEGAQMLSTACHKLLPLSTTIPFQHLLYKPTHENHPCNIWIRESFTNFLWLSSLVTALDAEHNNRYGTFTDHGVIADLALELMRTYGSNEYKERAKTPPAQAMPDELKIPDNPVLAYRRYYKQHKASIAKWERGVKPPTWWNDNELLT